MAGSQARCAGAGCSAGARDQHVHSSPLGLCSPWAALASSRSRGWVPTASVPRDEERKCQLARTQAQAMAQRRVRCVRLLNGHKAVSHKRRGDRSHLSGGEGKELVGLDLKLPQRLQPRPLPWGSSRPRWSRHRGTHSAGWDENSISGQHTLSVRLRSGTGQATSSPWPTSPGPGDGSSCLGALSLHPLCS